MIKDIKSPNLPSKFHGFFTTQSTNFNKSSEKLNFSFSEFEAQEKTMLNRSCAASQLGITSQKLISVRQVHSQKVLIIDSAIKQELSEADGLVTRVKGLGLSILTADCAPILFFDPKASVIGAAHAGWRGAVDGITDSTIDAMLTLGANKKDIIASIGPCISKKNYEVKSDFKKEIIKTTISAQSFFSTNSKNQIFFDLPNYILDRISSYGIKTISAINICTYSGIDQFHSYRRACHEQKHHYKRNISIIRL